MNFFRYLKSKIFRRRVSPLNARMTSLRKMVVYQPTNTPLPNSDPDLAHLRIAFVIPDFKPGAGGHMTIFRIASHLERFGHHVELLIQNPTVHKTAAAAAETINQYFQPFRGKITLFHGNTPQASGDGLIATDRFTCYPVNAMGGFRAKFYFVQDHEPLFYPMGAEYLLTDATYDFDFHCLCAGEWLDQLMRESYGRASTCWPLAFDPAVYCQNADVLRTRNRIAVYARHVTERRAVELILLALEELSDRGVEFEVDFFGWDMGHFNAPYLYQDHGILQGAELAALYQKATLGVVFSATNHSLVNKEMMACGLPVVDLDVDSVRAIFPSEVMAFAKPNPSGIADTIQKLMECEEERVRMRARAIDYVEQFSWQASARIVEAAIKRRVDQSSENV